MNSLKYSVLSPTYMAGVSRDIDLPVQYHPILVISPVISLGFFHMMLHVCFSENYLQVKGKSFVFLVLYFDIDIPHPIAPGKWKITFGRDIEVNCSSNAGHSHPLFLHTNGKLFSNIHFKVCFYSLKVL